ncbi:MAG: hypothetical protein DHS80DRAFT_32869 [Piptocephalis tieghemiana]|nr:MAG: hypothetical protein DHS80DRAFT_32869 [Piptocephalis tieghemiana]
MFQRFGPNPSSSTPRRKQETLHDENNLPAPPKTPSGRHSPRPVLLDRVNGTPRVRSSVLGAHSQTTPLVKPTPRKGDRMKKGGFLVHRDEPEVEKTLPETGKHYATSLRGSPEEPEEIEYAPPPYSLPPYDPGFDLDDDPCDQPEASQSDPHAYPTLLLGPPPPLPLEEPLLDPPSPTSSPPASPLGPSPPSSKDLYLPILPVVALKTRSIPPLKGLRLSPRSRLPLPLRLLPPRQRQQQCHIGSKRTPTGGLKRSRSSPAPSTKARRRLGRSPAGSNGTITTTTKGKGPRPPWRL